MVTTLNTGLSSAQKKTTTITLRHFFNTRNNHLKIHITDQDHTIIVVKIKPYLSKNSVQTASK